MNTSFSWYISLDNSEQLRPGRFNMLALAQGTWKDPNTFEIKVDEIGNNMQWLISATFEGDQVLMVVENKSRTFPLPLTLRGQIES
jgi:hypothetical protein